MNIDWVLVATIVGPLLSVILGVFLNRWFESRPKLRVWFSHIAEFDLKNNQTTTVPSRVHTHAVNIKNVGSKPAKNVNVAHQYLPDSFRIIPPIPHSIEELPGGGKNIVIPNLVPKKEVTITYLYYPPVTWNQINTSVEDEEGLAKVVLMTARQVINPWLKRSIALLVFIGLVTVIYQIVQIVKPFLAE
ncbi:hypothetical protein C0W35_18290 [Photobacterium kishitanii]|uniref:hypothetical protein n=1 Tax=Photobacterium kishitanii TaxID=318456 RepID=UPI000D156176|nr:hypothetical protein [Photobacterium kishitanii]PSU89954.1 hypothetical protein C0W35_18290 [Photobacterium kishitanii]